MKEKIKKMSSFKNFEDIEAWKKARYLANSMFQIVSKPEFKNDRRLRDQILGSSGSIMDNIAEGQGRGGDKEFKQYLWVAKGSSAELPSQLYRCLDRDFINDAVFKELYSQAVEIEKMIMGLITYINKSEFKGIKFKS